MRRTGSIPPGGHGETHAHRHGEAYVLLALKSLQKLADTLAQWHEAFIRHAPSCPPRKWCLLHHTKHKHTPVPSVSPVGWRLCTVVPCNKVHAVFQEICVPYAVVYLMLWYTSADPFRGPQYPQNCKNGPKKPQSPRKCTFLNIIRYLLDTISYIIIQLLSWEL